MWNKSAVAVALLLVLALPASAQIGEPDPLPPCRETAVVVASPWDHLVQWWESLWAPEPLSEPAITADPRWSEPEKPRVRGKQATP